MNHESMADCSANGYIIEVSSFKLPASLSPEAFAVLDKRVEEEFISNQNGFISRDSGISVDNEPRWVNIVKWRRCWMQMKTSTNLRASRRRPSKNIWRVSALSRWN